MRPAQPNPNPSPRPAFRPPHPQQQQQHPISRPGTPGGPPGTPGGYRPPMNGPGQRPPNSPMVSPRPPFNGAMQRPQSPTQRPPMSNMPNGPPGGIHSPGAPLQRPPPIGGMHGSSPMMRPSTLSQPGSPGMPRPYQSPQIQARPPPPGQFMGQNQQIAPGSPAMNPVGYNGPPNLAMQGYAQNRSQPPTPKMPHQQQYQQPQQQQPPMNPPQQPHQNQQPPQFQDPGVPTFSPMNGASTPTSHAGTGAHKPKRMYPQGINSYQDPVANTGFQPATVPGVPPPTGLNQFQPVDQGSQPFVPGVDQGSNFGQPVAAYQQGLQPLAGQPLQPNMNQLANQMGAMNVGQGYGYNSASGPS
ncbi:hypothetical protein BX616_010580, partial [Lobosporangium transversale]